METEKREVTGRVNGRFSKGFSGNPGGRPKKLPEVAVACREMTPSILNVLAGIIENEDAKDSDRIAACRLVLEYGIGKPQQMVTVDVTQKVDAMTDEERRNRIRELTAKMAIDADYEIKE